MVGDALPPGTVVGILGAGRVGAAVGAALARSGLPVVAASGVSQASRARAARLLPGVPLAEPADVARAAGLLVLAVPDDALERLVRRLVAAGAVRSGAVVVHTSGRHGLAVLAPATRVGAVAVAAHPAMTFTGTAADLDRLAGCAFGVTVDDADLPVAARLVDLLGGRLMRVAEPARPLYHAALAHGANHLVTLVADATELLARAGVADPSAVLGPLLRAALDGALDRGDAALTGPVARGDAQTVSGHLAAVAEVAPQALAGYVALSRRTAVRALAAGRLDEVSAAAVLDALAAADRRRVRA